MNGLQPGESARVAAADDDPVALLAIKTMIQNLDSLTFVGGAGDVEGIVNLTNGARPHVVVLDWMMPNGGGPEAARRILSDRPGTRIVGLSSHDSPGASLDMLRAGAIGFLLKGGSAEELEEAIRQALVVWA
jgi:DNA-binding NarL/FixJ family response regulator